MREVSDDENLKQKRRETDPTDNSAGRTHYISIKALRCNNQNFYLLAFLKTICYSIFQNRERRERLSNSQGLFIFHIVQVLLWLFVFFFVHHQLDDIYYTTD